MIIQRATELPYLSVVVKDNRIKLGLSQKDLAFKIGLGLKTLRKIEQGDLNVNFKKLDYLLNFFGLQLRPSALVTSPYKKTKVVLSQEYILDLLLKLLPILKLKYDVEKLYLFGSYAKNMAVKDSDIDVLIKYKRDISFEQEGEIILMLENLFSGLKVDLTNVDNVVEHFKEEIEETMINVTEKF